LIGYIDLSDSATLNFGLFNLTDKTYIRWADTVAIGSDAPARFSQPGFNAGLSLRVDL
jgi:outer membrane receptor protein involved in Fe transport